VDAVAIEHSENFDVAVKHDKQVILILLCNSTLLAHELHTLIKNSLFMFSGKMVVYVLAIQKCFIVKKYNEGQWLTPIKINFPDMPQDSIAYRSLK